MANKNKRITANVTIICGTIGIGPMEDIDGNRIISELDKLLALRDCINQYLKDYERSPERRK